MVGISLSDLAVSTFTKGLQTFEHIITEAEKYAKEKGIDGDATFFQARLIEDQLPFAFQVQNATKAVQVSLGRLTGVKPTLFEDNEKTIAGLHERIQKTLKLLKTTDFSAASAREEELLDLPWKGETHKLSRKALFLNNGLPNFFFHLNTGYSILRFKGVPLGKADYLTNFLAL
ncbi:hypothetical protein BJ170DRAFT_692485 [Xylariales sp. AK1849]|nr:hypothetical protein BJ170DRAFT_692485 [Xylariales sp. AK1849]